MVKKLDRTTQGLRDILFDEIDMMRSDKADPTRALAVAKLARQIISTAEVELELCRTMNALSEKGQPVLLGGMRLGSKSDSVADADETATGR